MRFDGDRLATGTLPAPMDPQDQLRELIVRFAEDPEWLPAVAEAITAAAHAAEPELYGDAELAGGTLAGVESILRQILYMAQNGVPATEATLPPFASEQMRRFVQRGAPLDSLLLAYQVGHAAFFRLWAAAARRLIEDPAERVEAVELGANWSFEYIEALSARAVADYREENDRWVRSAAAVRRETVQALLADGDPDLAAAERRLGYDLGRRHLAFVVWCDPETERRGDSTLVRLELAGEQLATDFAAGKPLLVPLGARLMAGWLGGVRQAPAPPRLDRDSVGPVRAAFGTEAVGIEGFRLSHEQALEARRAADLMRASPGSVTRYRDVALVALAGADERQARRFVAGELGPLTATDDQTSRLAATLLVYLQEQMSRRRAARRLAIHENTVTNRIHAAEQLLGHPVDERACELEVAIRMVNIGS